MKHPNWNEVTGVFGGTFDPPHLGHRIALEDLAQMLGMEKVLVQVSATPPLKADSSPLEHRLAMTRLAFKEPISGLSVEIETDGDEKGSFTVDLLRRLSGERDLAFIVGSDQIEQFPRWKEFPELLKLSHWIILIRKPHRTKEIQAALESWVDDSTLLAPEGLHYSVPECEKIFSLFETRAPELSSTELRDNLDSRVNSAVLGYLKDHHLYGT